MQSYKTAINMHTRVQETEAGEIVLAWGINNNLCPGAREPWRQRRDRSPNLYAVAPLPIFCSPKF